MSPLRSSLLAGSSRVRVDFRIPLSLPDNFTVPSASGNMKCSPLFGVIISLALSLRAWISDAPKFTSFMSATKIFPFQISPREPIHIQGTFQVKLSLPNWWSLDWSFAELGWYSTITPNGKTVLLNGSPCRLSNGVFPSNRRSGTFRR